jgi:integrase/recombinase XerD
MARKNRRRPHGAGSVYQRGPGNFWVKWREDGEIKYAHGFPTRDLAEQAREQIAARIAQGNTGRPIEPVRSPALSGIAAEWLERRKTTHRAWREDRNRWNRHLDPFFGKMAADTIDSASIRAFVELKLKEGLSSTTVGHLVRLLSTLYTDIVERKLAPLNPVRGLTRATRKLYRNARDPADTPFLETMDAVRDVYRALPAPFNLAFAIGAMGGLRTGEILALQWCDVDVVRRRIRVHQQARHGKLGPVKDDDSRQVPILDSLLPLLEAGKREAKDDGLILRPANPRKGGREGRPPTFLNIHTVHRAFRRALQAVHTGSPLTWYQATRHTFASQWVLSGGSIEKLAKIMGHSSVTTTERYAHHRTDLFRAEDLSRMGVDLTVKREVGYAVATQEEIDAKGRLVTT